jgi:hypothetical protein
MYGRIHELLHRNPRFFGEGDAARRRAAIDDRHNDDCVLEARPGTLGIPRSCTNAEEAFTPPSRSLCNKALVAMGFWRHLRLPSSINRPVAPPTPTPS